jgi:hypothetical protein
VLVGLFDKFRVPWLNKVNAKKTLPLDAADEQLIMKLPRGRGREMLPQRIIAAIHATISDMLHTPNQTMACIKLRQWCHHPSVLSELNEREDNLQGVTYARLGRHDSVSRFPNVHAYGSATMRKPTGRPLKPGRSIGSSYVLFDSWALFSVET